MVNFRLTVNRSEPYSRLLFFPKEIVCHLQQYYYPPFKCRRSLDKFCSCLTVYPTELVLRLKAVSA